jgi:tRNA(fMet)-specific endonuclease VapC
MMLVLDTDHLTEYQKGTSAESRRLIQRLERAAESYATTIVTVEEIMRGWMAAIHRMQDVRRQVTAYAKLQQLLRFFATLTRNTSDFRRVPGLQIEDWLS